MPKAIIVGIFVTLCLLILGLLIFQVENLDFFGPEGSTVDALFDTVAGLDDKAPVRIAGVRVGTVDTIALEGRRARVTLRLEQPIELTQGAAAALVNSGLLGDKYIEIIPGEPGGIPLPEDAVLEGRTPVTLERALERFDGLGEKLEDLAVDVSRRGDLGVSIRRLVDNLEATSADIRSLVATNKSQVNTTLANFEDFSATLAAELPRLSAQLTALLGSVESLVDDNRGDLDESLANLREITDGMKTSVGNLNRISSQIQSGEGTLGKLVYDDAAHDSLVSTLGAVEKGVDGISKTLERVNSLQLGLSLEGFTYTDIEEGGAAFRLQLVNHPRRFYEIGLVSTPQGKFTEETRTITTTFPDGSVETTVINEQLQEDDYTLTAQIGYTFGRLRLRAGLIESSGGAGLEYGLFDDRLRFSIEAFDFSRAEELDPHLRFTTRFDLHPNVYLLGGYDDPLVDQYESIFVGAGIRWKDEDLKYLLGSAARGF